MKRVAACLVLLLPQWLSAQAVLSRRVYAEHGRTWQQIWISDATTNFRQLTHSPRDHSEPRCSRDGRLVYFVSDRDAERSRNAIPNGYPGERELWSFDRRTGRERMVWSTSDQDGLDLIGIAADGGAVVNVKSALHKIGGNPWRIDRVVSARFSPDGTRLTIAAAGSFDAEGQPRDENAYIVDSVRGKTRVPAGKCESMFWSPSGARIACESGREILVLDPASGRQIETIRFSGPESPIESVVWAPDEGRVLVGIYGENGGSGDPQSDYFLFNPATQTWARQFTAESALWLTGGEKILYVRPIDLLPIAPGSRHSVWSSQLAIYDLATHRDTALTSGVVMNGDMAFCGR